MKIQNTLTQKELEILLRYANWAHTTFEWRFGQAIFNGLHIMFPTTAEEIRTSPINPFYKDTVKADFYAAICPDPPRYTGTPYPESEINSEAPTKEQQQVLDLTNSFTKKHK